MRTLMPSASSARSAYPSPLPPLVESWSHPELIPPPPRLLLPLLMALLALRELELRSSGAPVEAVDSVLLPNESEAALGPHLPFTPARPPPPPPAEVVCVVDTAAAGENPPLPP